MGGCGCPQDNVILELIQCTVHSVTSLTQQHHYFSALMLQWLCHDMMDRSKTHFDYLVQNQVCKGGLQSDLDPFQVGLVWRMVLIMFATDHCRMTESRLLCSSRGKLLETAHVFRSGCCKVEETHPECRGRCNMAGSPLVCSSGCQMERSNIRTTTALRQQHCFHVNSEKAVPT